MKKLMVCAVLLMGVMVSNVCAENVKAIDFTLKTLDGEEVTLSSLQGKKVLIDFFATWCPPCRRELKEINEIVNEYPQDTYAILCVSVDRSKETVVSFMEKNGYDMTVLFDEGKHVSTDYGVGGIPALYLVDEEGNLVWHQAGALPKESLLELLGL